MNPHRLNCSQLVWFAYVRTTGTDIDGNGGMGAYPRDLLMGRYPIITRLFGKLLMVRNVR